MITISLCMIVKNEEAVLGRCLESVRDIADEIVIVDTGSQDKTIAIAKQFTKRVYPYKWIDDFSAARNYSFSKATKDFIMWLDADDVIDEESRAKFIEMKKTLPPDTGKVMLPYNTAFDAQGKPIFSYFRERMVNRKSNPLWHEPVHEHLTAAGKLVQLDAAVSHLPGIRDADHSDRNLRIYRKRVKRGEELSTRGEYYFARELKTHGLWDEAIKQYEMVLKKPDLWMEDAITGSADLAECYMQKGNENKALEVLFASFYYDLPRAEIVCKIGEIYSARKNYPKAIFWYDLVLTLSKPSGWGFYSKDYWDYIPHMQLCMLNDRIGKREMALFHHEAAKKIRPDSKAVLYNEEYFYKNSSGN